MSELTQLPGRLHEVVKAFLRQKIKLRRRGNHGFRNYDLSYNRHQAVKLRQVNTDQALLNRSAGVCGNRSCGRLSGRSGLSGRSRSRGCLACRSRLGCGRSRLRCNRSCLAGRLSGCGRSLLTAFYCGVLYYFIGVYTILYLITCTAFSTSSGVASAIKKPWSMIVSLVSEFVSTSSG